MRARVLKLPWEHERLHDRPDYIPWTHRRWLADTKCGAWVQADAEYERARAVADRVLLNVKPHSHRTQCRELTFTDLTAIVGICRQKKMKVMDAILEHVGEDNLPPSWVREAQASRPAYVEGGIPEDLRTEEEIQTWVDEPDTPRKRKTAQTRREPLPT